MRRSVLTIGTCLVPVCVLFAQGPSITTATVPDAAVGKAYTPLTFTVTGGMAPYTFVETPVSPFDPDGLPPGMTVTTAGVLRGTPSKAGTFNFNLTATDSAKRQAVKTFSLLVIAPLAITTVSALPEGTVGATYSETIGAFGGSPPYSFSASMPPAGLTLHAGGILNGTPTAAGTFSFDVTVTDSAKTSVIKTFAIAIAAAPQPAQVSPLMLNFAAPVNGNSPPSQTINVLDDGSPLAFHVVLDSGQANSAAPAWLSVKPVNGKTPARLTVTVDPGSMDAGTYTGRIRIVDNSPAITDVPVTMVIATHPPLLDTFPNLLRFGALLNSSSSQERLLVLDNKGGGAMLPFTAQVLNGSSWIASITPSSGTIRRNSPAFVRVRVNAQGLAMGRYHDFVRVITTAGNVDVRVVLFVTKSAPILSVDVTALRLQARQSGGFSNTRSFKVQNIGDPFSTIHWTAEVVKGGQFLSLGSTSGTATPSKPGALSVSLTAAATEADPGGYYGLIKISDPDALNPTQYVVVVLDLNEADDPPLPDPSPAALFFSAPPGMRSAVQTVAVNTSSSTPVPFRTGALTEDGGSWLTVTPTSGESSGASPGTVDVSVDTTGLTPGFYYGNAGVVMSSTLRIINVTLVVLPGTGATTATATAASCTPGKLGITETGVVNNFAVPAAWPASIIVQLNDDCGNLVTDGAVIASFSNGDPALSLRGDSTGLYSATWQPGSVSSDMEVTIRAASGTLLPATFTIDGSIAQNTVPAPMLASNGVLHNLNPVVGGALAPGTVAQVYGTGLASATASPNILPLPSTFNGTTVLIGGIAAPLYYLSDGQLNVEIPSELTPDQPYSIIASANGSLTLPDSIDLISVTPGIASYGDGHTIAQHSDFSLVDATRPAKPGEYLVIYLVGMGATNPSVASGQAAPSTEPLARVTVTPTLTIGGQNASIVYAGLTPGFAGLYQINFQVPDGLKSGDLDLVVMQSGQSSNTTQLRVSQ